MGCLLAIIMVVLVWGFVMLWSYDYDHNFSIFDDDDDLWW